MAFSSKKSLALYKCWTSKSAGFKSDIDGMKGHVFDCKGSNNATAFKRTHKEMTNYVQ